MKIIINQNQFINAFKTSSRADEFSAEALAVMYDYLTEFQKNTDIEMKLDVVSLCCEFAEYELNDLLNDFESLEYVQQNTTVLEVSTDNYLIVNF